MFFFGGQKRTKKAHPATWPSASLVKYFLQRDQKLAKSFTA
jgi:hypothetical protein